MSKNAITISKAKLEYAVSILQNAVNKKYTIDITSNILLETIGDKLVMKATQNEFLSIKMNIKPDSIEGSINCAVNAEALDKWIKGLQDDALVLELKDDYLHITQKRTSSKFQIFDGEDFPFRESYTDKESDGIYKFERLEIDNKLMLDTLKEISHCCLDKENFNIALLGVLLDIKDSKLTFASTDTKRLAYLIKDYKDSSVKIDSVIPKKAIVELAKIFNADFETYVKKFPDSDSKVEVIAFVNEEIEFYTRTINQTFPNFKEVITQRPNIKPFSIEKDKILKAFHQINQICSKTKMILKQNEVILESIYAISNSSGKIIIEDVETNLESTTETGIVNKHIIDCIANTKADIIDIYINEETGNIYFDLKDYKEVIVPCEH